MNYFLLNTFKVLSSICGSLKENKNIHISEVCFKTQHISELCFIREKMYAK